MSPSYDHREVESKWSRRWQREGTYSVNLADAKRPYYNLMMFPYPSAEGLHVGNMFSFIGSDVHGRFMRARGHDVFEPMGFDAFGIHSENYAIKVGQHPARLTPRSVERFRREQLMKIGAMYDWSHEICSSDPAYYRWSQWIFVKLFQADLAYRKKAPVNWCPSCQTVLADEQVVGGACERCGAAVGQRHLCQWFVRITAYAERLLANLDRIDWSRITTEAQRRWIGRSEGAEVVFPVVHCDEEIVVFTTRPDTLWGATFLVLAPEHPLVEKLTTASRRGAVRRYVEAAGSKSLFEREDASREKSGVFTGAYAVHPATGERIPIWVADYVVTGYGTGALMAVPAHDRRDHDFARNYGLPLTEVIVPEEGRADGDVYEGEGRLKDSGPFTGTPSSEAIPRIARWLEKRNKGGPAVTYRLHDWCISRQRYWGPPIPVVHCGKCGAVPVPEDDLPVVLPFMQDFRPDGSGLSPLARCEAFVRTTCPKCGGSARRETDVSDNFLDSAWYFLRFLGPDREDIPFDKALAKKWLPVNMYVGGNEHAVLHLMYARFIAMALHDLGFVDVEEPFQRFRANGIIVKDGAKMSKSRGNVINPDHYIGEYGADTLRTYLMFMGRFHVGGDFRDEGIIGTRRFLERVWRYVTESSFVRGPIQDDLTLRLVHRTIKKATERIASFRYNTAVSAVHEMLNSLTGGRTHYRQAALALLQMLCPFAPHLAHELWERLGGVGLCGDAAWPDYDPDLAVEKSVDWAVLVNGKVRAHVELPADADQEEVETEAFRQPRIRELLSGKRIAHTQLVPGRLLSLTMDPGS